MTALVPDFSKATPKELVSYFDTYYQIYITTYHPMVWAIYASDLEELFGSELRKLLDKDEQTKEKVIEFTAMLLTPTRLTTVQKEEQVLFEIHDAFENRKPGMSFDEFCKQKEINDKLEVLENEHGWFHMEYIGEPWRVKDYKEHLKKRFDEFKKGKVVKATAEKGEKLLKSLLAIDDGAKRLGEVAIGTNTGIKQFTKKILFDEKLGGTIHMAIGAEYMDCKGTAKQINKSAVHWDIIKDMKKDGEIIADGVTVYKNGKWLMK